MSGDSDGALTAARDGFYLLRSEVERLMADCEGQSDAVVARVTREWIRDMRGNLTSTVSQRRGAHGGR